MQKNQLQLTKKTTIQIDYTHLLVVTLTTKISRRFIKVFFINETFQNVNILLIGRLLKRYPALRKKSILFLDYQYTPKIN